MNRPAHTAIVVALLFGGSSCCSQYGIEASFSFHDASAPAVTKYATLQLLEPGSDSASSAEVILGPFGDTSLVHITAVRFVTTSDTSKELFRIARDTLLGRLSSTYDGFGMTRPLWSSLLAGNVTVLFETDGAAAAYLPTALPAQQKSCHQFTDI